MRKYYFVVLFVCLLFPFFLHAQTIAYHIGNQSWDPDKLGNQRAVVTVTGESKVAEVTVPWRCRKVTPDQQVIVMDARTGQRINNVVVSNMSRYQGTIDFEPISGSGKYYIYFLPYELKKPVNYPNAVYNKMTKTASADWEASLSSSPKAAVKIDYIESYNALNSFYPMEVIATEAETAGVINHAREKPYLIFPETRLNPVK